MEILVVEDDRRMAALLSRGLNGVGHQVFVASDGIEGLEFAQLRAYDIIVLDALLPGLDGFEITRQLRKSRNQTPILMLTARDAPQDVARGLDLGADDYLTKPFAFEELLARIRAVSRRGPIPRSVCLEVADLRLDPASREITRSGTRIELTAREFQILELLMHRAGRVVERFAIIDAVWGTDSDIEPNTLDAFISSLRRKVESDGPRLIHTVRGIGFIVRGSD